MESYYLYAINLLVAKFLKQETLSEAEKNMKLVFVKFR